MSKSERITCYYCKSLFHKRDEHIRNGKSYCYGCSETIGGVEDYERHIKIKRVNPRIIELTQAVMDFAEKTWEPISEGNKICKITKKDQPMKDLYDYIENNINNNECANCNYDASPDQYTASTKKEYYISALCDRCQRYFFNKPAFSGLLKDRERFIFSARAKETVSFIGEKK